MRSLTKWLTGIIFVMSATTAVSAQSPAIYKIRTASPVVLNPAVPMVSQYPALPVYIQWMKELAECEGLALPPIEEFLKTQYFQVNASDFQINDDRANTYYAVTVPDPKGSGVMYISIGHYLDSRIVKHEDLHILLLFNFPDARYTHDPAKQHPVEYFGQCDVKPN